MVETLRSAHVANSAQFSKFFQSAQKALKGHLTGSQRHVVLTLICERTNGKRASNRRYRAPALQEAHSSLPLYVDPEA